jgi:hypothetical protein
MKTISIETATMTNFGTMQPLGRAGERVFRKNDVRVPRWRPVPVVKQVKPVCARANATKKVRSIWIPVEKPGITERAAFGLLSLVGVGCIGYGVVHLLNLVQNWAAFQNGIAQFIQ